ncbi:MAG: transposase, partial [Oscillospiraceae bacterium]|nr:transposase [Oscillospiraceae bacterium]
MKRKEKSVSFDEFCEMFPSEESCRARLFSMRWPEGFECPKCGCKEYGYHEKKKVYQCKDKYCRHQASVTAGTVMEHTRLPIKVWFWAIFLVATDKRGSSATYLSGVLKIRYKSAWLLLQKLRSAMGNRDARYLLEGIVEFDDT